MKAPRLASTIERRLLVNYRVAPEAVAALLPAPLRPQLVNGHAVAGICLLRLGEVRPLGLPRGLGLRSENAAHRFAVEWDGPDGVQAGVYIPRRDTGSALNAWAGGRIFPGEHGRADFDVRESERELRVALATRDGEVRVDVTVETADELHGSALFADLAAASEFFRQGAHGYSATGAGDHLDGMELRTDRWGIEPCTIRSAASSYFADPDRFPPGTVELDSALLMRRVPADWHPLPAMATVRTAA